MKLAVLSDLHLEFRESFVPSKDPSLKFFDGVDLPAEIEADAIVIAGDVHPSERRRRRFFDDLETAYEIPVLSVEGNHDYYHSKWPGFKGVIQEVNGVTFALSTHWTNVTHQDPCDLMNDFHLIKGISVEAWSYAHFRSREFLTTSCADVIVTHHAPSLKSVQPKYFKNALNPFFASDDDVDSYPARLWIHGHMHDRIDYRTRTCRVFCNPLGYPREWRSQGLAAPRTVEIIEV